MNRSFFFICFSHHPHNENWAHSRILQDVWNISLFNALFNRRKRKRSSTGQLNVNLWNGICEMCDMKTNLCSKLKILPQDIRYLEICVFYYFLRLKNKTVRLFDKSCCLIKVAFSVYYIQYMSKFRVVKIPAPTQPLRG